MLSAAEKTQFNQNRLGRMGKELLGKTQVVKAVYDFAVLGGAQGTLNLVDEEGNEIDLPSGAIVKDVCIDEITNVTSGGGATIALGVNTTTDIKAATAIATYANRIGAIPDGAAANSVKLTADRKVQLTIGTADLTAGKLDIYLEILFVPAAA